MASRTGAGLSLTSLQGTQSNEQPPPPRGGSAGLQVGGCCPLTPPLPLDHSPRLPLAHRPSLGLVQIQASQRGGEAGRSSPRAQLDPTGPLISRLSEGTGASPLLTPREFVPAQSWASSHSVAVPAHLGPYQSCPRCPERTPVRLRRPSQSPLSKCNTPRTGAHMLPPPRLLLPGLGEAPHAPPGRAAGRGATRHHPRGAGLHLRRGGRRDAHQGGRLGTTQLLTCFPPARRSSLPVLLPPRGQGAASG